MMTSKERMLMALRREKPDRLPITIHQWQGYHLREFMNGVDQLEAFQIVGLDASVSPWDVVRSAASANWIAASEELGKDGNETLRRHRIRTPDGDLTWITGANDYTTYNTEHMLKSPADVELFLKHWPNQHLDQARLAQWYDRVGDAGIVRGFVAHAAQPGVWQEFCELVGTQAAIYWAADEPALVHHFLEEMTRRKVDYVHREMVGAKFDLIEHGGGAASSTVISPAMFDEFCVPYDRRVIAALHEHGFKVVYHTCGGMMAILDHIPQNGCDASETLSPPGVGGDIQPADRVKVKQVLGSKVALIGGIDQGRILTEGTPAIIRQHVRECYETFGAGGGYICSASDHFFHTPVENLKALAQAGRECVY